MIAVDALTVRFPEVPAPTLTDVDLAVGPGERVLLLGTSGSGKSTLLRVLAGIVPQTVDADVQGRVRVAGLPVLDPDAGPTPVARLAARVATLTQDPADQLCLPTVAEETAFALENRAVDPVLIGPRVARALDAVGAGHLAERRTGELSGGEGQRVALAACLVADPDVLLLDEPTALLDPAGVGGVADALAGATRAPRTSVLIEHRLDELGGLPERVVVLAPDGTVRADGPTGAVLRDEAAALVAMGIWLPLAAELVAAGLDGPQGLGRLVAGSACAEAAPGARPPGGAPALVAHRLGVRRGPRAVLDGVDLRLHPGRVTAVLGRNGSGKSSLLLALAGLAPSSGTVVGGSVGMVFQRPEDQFLGRTVRDEIAWSPRRARLPDVEQRVARAMADHVLDGLGARDPFRLSGGQQRRLSLAAVAVCDHDVLLADEPTFAQDRHTGRATGQALRALADDGRAVLVATHDLRLVADVVDEVLVLADGRVAGVGPAEAVLADTALLRAAGLRLPPLLEVCRRTGHPLRTVLRALDEATAAATASPLGATGPVGS